MVMFENKKYSRTCHRCRDTFRTSAKHGRVCTDCRKDYRNVRTIDGIPIKCRVCGNKVVVPEHIDNFTCTPCNSWVDRRARLVAKETINALKNRLYTMEMESKEILKVLKN